MSLGWKMIVRKSISPLLSGLGMSRPLCMTSLRSPSVTFLGLSWKKGSKIERKRERARVQVRERFRVGKVGIRGQRRDKEMSESVC